MVAFPDEYPQGPDPDARGQSPHLTGGALPGGAGSGGRAHGPSGPPLPPPSVPAGAAPFVTGGPAGATGGSPPTIPRPSALEEDDGDPDIANLTNVYYLAQYSYQLSI